VSAADADTAIAVSVVPGQSHDAPQLKGMLDQAAERVSAMKQVVGDKGFDGAEQRQACLDHGAKPVIPHRSNTKEPTRLNQTAYRARNEIERLLGKAKEFRRIATRYEKLKRTFCGLIHLVLGFLRVRRTINVNTA
jgi:transposase